MRIVSIAWSKLSRRTVDISRNISAELLFIKDKAPYWKAWRKTGVFLQRVKPDIVLIQLPQGPLLLRAMQISRKLGFKIISDVHTGFIYTTTVKELLLNRPFHSLLRKSDLILAHNPLQRKLMVKKQNLDDEKIILVYDPLPQLPRELVEPNISGIEPKNYILLPASWAPDEPLDFIVSEFIKSNISNEYRLVITNDFTRNPRAYLRIKKLLQQKGASGRVLFPGYLNNSEYYWLLKNSKLVVTVTSREFTMLSAIWEAVSCNIPFIAPETIALKAVIGEYPLFFQFMEGNLKEIFEKGVNENLDEISKTLNLLKELSHDSMEKLRRKLYKF